jgi:sulfide:quinone oxidoreductase
MNSAASPTRPFRTVIAGGGVAALEAALALRELAGNRLTTTLLAPEPDFVYRPMRVREPFGRALARRYPLDEIARAIDVELVEDAFKWLDAERSIVHTAGGAELGYDALLLALGARPFPAFRHALTIDDGRLDEQLHGLIQDVEGGYVDSLAFLAPSLMAWPLPIYELALMTADRARDMGIELSITLVTPEDRPLALFGVAAGDEVSRLLENRGIAFIGSAHCTVPQPGVVSIHPGGRAVQADRVVALPQLRGPECPGIPGQTRGGFIPVDAYCRVPGLQRVWAAGDATDFAIKHGGIAAQQADTAARGIAALAGATVRPEPFRPELHAVLLGGEKPLHLSAQVTGGHGTDSRVSYEPGRSSSAKIAARYLAPYLESHDRLTTSSA